MPKYRYTVVNKDNKQLQGSISAPDEEGARGELNELGFSIIAMEEIAEEEKAAPEVEIPTFEFAAVDKNQKRVVGTIQSEDRYTAYKRLITEYALEVEYVINNDLAETKKEKARKKGSYDLYTKYEEEQGTTKEKVTGDEKDLMEFEKKQAILKEQIEYVLEKVKEMLDQYEKEMKVETKAKLRKQVEKVLRIKNSTNLDYVRNAAEELLTFLQKEEIFMHEDQRVKERTKMLVEAKGMMMQLKKSKTQKGASLTETLMDWRQEHITKNENPSTMDRITNSLISIIIGAEPESEDVSEIKRKIRTLNDQIKQFIVMYFQAPSPEFKSETKESLKNLWNRRKKLNKQLRDIKKAIIEERKKSSKLTSMEKLAAELHSFTGWLLAFYLIYYFASIYAISKDFGLAEVPYFFYIYKSAFLKYFLVTLFLGHGVLSLKIYFFRRNEIATLIITPVFLASLFLIYFNF